MTAEEYAALSRCREAARREVRGYDEQGLLPREGLERQRLIDVIIAHTMAQHGIAVGSA